LEAEALKVARAADIPRIGNDEAAALVQFAEGLAFVGGGRAGHRHSLLRKSRGSVPRLSHREQCHSVMGASALLMGRWRGRGASATLAALERRRSDGLCRSGCAGASGA